MSPNSYHKRIITDGRFLGEGYQPKIIHAREKQVRDLISHLSSTCVVKGPTHVWLYGPTGSGKTCTARYVLSELSQRHNLRSAYINCWNHHTLFSILESIEHSLRLLGSATQSTTVKLEKFSKAVGPKPFILVLDEIDKVAPQERNTVLYRLSSIGNLSLICIASNRYPFHTLDKRVKSRLNPKLVEFNPYTNDDLAGVLRYRAELALEPDAWSERTLRRISQLAIGDARCALKMLVIASLLAEKDGSKVIQDKHTRAAWNQARELNAVYALSKLGEHHQLLYQLVKKKGEALSGELWRLYLRRCKVKKLKPIAIRTFSEYMNRLIREGLVKGDRAQSRGKVRIFRIINKRRD